MRRAMTGLALAGAMLVAGCAAEAEDLDATAERSGPATLAPDDLGEDTVDLDGVQQQIDDLRTHLDEADLEVRGEAVAALDQAQDALDEAGTVRDSGTQQERDSAAQAVEDAVAALEEPNEASDEAYGRALGTLVTDLRRLAEELRRAPG